MTRQYLLSQRSPECWLLERLCPGEEPQKVGYFPRKTDAEFARQAFELRAGPIMTVDVKLSDEDKEKIRESFERAYGQPNLRWHQIPPATIVRLPGTLKPQVASAEPAHEINVSLTITDPDFDKTPSLTLSTILQEVAERVLLQRVPGEALSFATEIEGLGSVRISENIDGPAETVQFDGKLSDEARAGLQEARRLLKGDDDTDDDPDDDLDPMAKAAALEQVAASLDNLPSCYQLGTLVETTWGLRGQVVKVVQKPPQGVVYHVKCNGSIFALRQGDLRAVCEPAKETPFLLPDALRCPAVCSQLHQRCELPKGHSGCHRHDGIECAFAQYALAGVEKLPVAMPCWAIQMHEQAALKVATQMIREAAAPERPPIREGLLYSDPEISAKEPEATKPLAASRICRGCGQPLSGTDRCADGCPCNSPRGINHGLVPSYVCTCAECDPEQTGSVRQRPDVKECTCPREVWLYQGCKCGTMGKNT